MYSRRQLLIECGVKAQLAEAPKKANQIRFRNEVVLLILLISRGLKSYHLDMSFGDRYVWARTIHCDFRFFKRHVDIEKSKVFIKYQIDSKLLGASNYMSREKTKCMRFICGSSEIAFHVEEESNA